MNDRRTRICGHRATGLWLVACVVLLAIWSCDDGDDGNRADDGASPPPLDCFFTGQVACGDRANGVNGCVMDSCNWCGCEAQSAIAACTAVACDTITCTSQPDCPEGHECLWNSGCDQTHGFCNRQTYYCPHTSHSFTLCDCDGNTIRIDANACLPDRRYSHAGACD